jgi:TRAP-type C4-dicarboxylate transport system substrate-binding protein
MKNKAKLFWFCVCLALAILAGCKQKAGRPQAVLKLGHVLDIAHPVHKAMVYMAKRVKEKSGGRMIVEIYPSEQLGTGKECIESVQLGGVS